MTLALLLIAAAGVLVLFFLILALPRHPKPAPPTRKVTSHYSQTPPQAEEEHDNWPQAYDRGSDGGGR